jgi:hypothetical protein
MILTLLSDSECRGYHHHRIDPYLCSTIFFWVVLLPQQNQDKNFHVSERVVTPASTTSLTTDLTCGATTAETYQWGTSFTTRSNGLCERKSEKQKRMVLISIRLFLPLCLLHSSPCHLTLQPYRLPFKAAQLPDVSCLALHIWPIQRQQTA